MSQHFINYLQLYLFTFGLTSAYMFKYKLAILFLFVRSILNVENPYTSTGDVVKMNVKNDVGILHVLYFYREDSYEISVT